MAVWIIASLTGHALTTHTLSSTIIALLYTEMNTNTF